MVDNQHRLISGYRELTPHEIQLINDIKAESARLGRLVAELRVNTDLDQRWISIGATDLQTGTMALVRGVTKPDGF